MKTGFAALIGVGVLSLAVGVGTASAATRHYKSHTVKHAPQAPAVGAQYGALTQSGNNPAKQYAMRHMPDGAIKTSTLPTGGNNPAKAYAARHMPENAMHEATLPTNGNNPAKRYAATASR
jgi:hypothetical protein